MKKKLNILFVHFSGKNGQFFPVCEYLEKSGKANTFFLGGENMFGSHFDPNRHFTFTPDGNIDQAAYYYSWWAEISTRISIGIYKEVKELQNKIPIDIIVGHHLYGSLNLLYDEFSIPLITYLEHPSFRHYQWDKQYPPSEGQVLHDKAYEMLSYFHLLKSDVTVVPSNYTKTMIPQKIRNKVKVIPDGIDISTKTSPQNLTNKNNKIIYIGFTARVLSSEKGFEQFIKISRALLKKNPNFHFIIIGSEDGISYGYDKQNVQSLGFKSFKEYILKKFPIQQKNYTFYEFLSYEDYSSLVNEIDIFLYPLQYGSATWGLFEFFLRGKPIITSNRCFIPEVIQDGYNGILCDYEDIDGWVNAIIDLTYDKNKRVMLGENAKKSAKKYSVEKVAKEYLKVFKQVLKSSKN